MATSTMPTNKTMPPPAPATPSAGTTLTFRNHQVSHALIHGLLMSVAFAVLLPLGAGWISLLRPRRHRWVMHGIWQCCSVALVLCGLVYGMGMVGDYSKVPYHHGTLGIVAVALLCTSPLLGIAHHYLRISLPSESIYHHKYSRVAANVHRALAIAGMAIGFVNGAFGFKYSQAAKAYFVTYLASGGMTVVIWLFGRVLAHVDAETRRLSTGDAVARSSATEGSGDEMAYDMREVHAVAIATDGGFSGWYGGRSDIEMAREMHRVRVSETEVGPDSDGYPTGQATGVGGHRRGVLGMLDRGSVSTTGTKKTRSSVAQSENGL